MKTSVEAFRLSLAAFIVPFMFFGSHELLIASRNAGHHPCHMHRPFGNVPAVSRRDRVLLWSCLHDDAAGAIGAAQSMIAVGWMTDPFGLTIAVALFLWQKRMITPTTLSHGRTD